MYVCIYIYIERERERYNEINTYAHVLHGAPHEAAAVQEEGRVVVRVLGAVVLLPQKCTSEGM